MAMFWTALAIIIYELHGATDSPARECVAVPVRSRPARAGAGAALTDLAEQAAILPFSDIQSWTIMVSSKWLYLAASLALAGAALAADPAPRYDAIEMQADAQREVANDTLSASLFVELNDANPATLAPDLEGGVSLVTVAVSGAIEVLD
jgi:hypothetical protein